MRSPPERECNTCPTSCSTTTSIRLRLKLGYLVKKAFERSASVVRLSDETRQFPIRSTLHDPQGGAARFRRDRLAEAGRCADSIWCARQPRSERSRATSRHAGIAAGGPQEFANEALRFVEHRVDPMNPQPIHATALSRVRSPDHTTARHLDRTCRSPRNLHKLLDPEIRAKNLRAARYAVRGRYWDLVRPDAPDPIFIVGCSRSGTTVTYETIATAPGLLSFGWEIPEFWENLWGPQSCNWESHAAGAEHARPEHRDAAQRYFFAETGPRAGARQDLHQRDARSVPLHACFRRPASSTSTATAGTT